MNEINHSHHQHGDPNGGSVHHGGRPYWTRAHRDWRVWVGVVLMLAAMTVYLMTDDLAGWRHSRPRQPIAGPAGN
jgi:hypothetical protein